MHLFMTVLLTLSISGSSTPIFSTTDNEQERLLYFKHLVYILKAESTCFGE